MADKPIHAPLVQFPVIDDELIVGGMKLTQLASRVGRTPFFAYDREAMARRVGELRQILPDGISLHYAMKANPMPAVVDHMASLVDGLDVASAGEMQIALDSGTGPADISFAGPGKHDNELTAAIAAGITLNLESENELERALLIGNALGIVPNLAVRVNPDFELKSSGMKMSGGPKPFGIDAERVPQVLERIGESDAHFRGLHIFSGSQNLRPDSLIEAQTATFELAYRLAEHTPGKIETLNIGGGFGVPYFPGETRLDLTEVSDNLEQRLAECESRLGSLEIVIELGRYLVAEAGIYVCRILDKKISRGTTYLVTDGGLHHHLAASGNFGQVIRKNYPVLIADKVNAAPRETASVVGPLCTPLDILGDKMDLGVADVGDLVVIMQSGAYGYTASPHLFLGHPSPVQVLV